MKTPAPPGADVLSIASRVWYTEIDGKPQSPGWTITAYARALQQYGAERAAAAIDEILYWRKIALEARAPEMTQKMIEAGIAAYGADDARSTPERVLDIWLAMIEAAHAAAGGGDG